MSDEPITDRQFLERILVERDARYEARFIANEKAVDTALDAQKELTAANLASANAATSAAFAASEKAITKAEQANEKRLEGLNEFRSQMAEQQAGYITKAEAELQFAAMKEKIEALSKSDSAGTGEKVAAKWFVGIVVALALAVIGVVEFVIRSK